MKGASPDLTVLPNPGPLRKDNQCDKFENVTEIEMSAYEGNDSKCEQPIDVEVSNDKSLVAPHSVFGVCADIPSFVPRKGSLHPVIILECFTFKKLQVKLIMV